MATPVFACGFECGILSIVTGSSHWAVSATVAPTISTTTVRSGARLERD